MPEQIRWDAPAQDVAWDDEIAWDAPGSPSSKAARHLAGDMGAGQIGKTTGPGVGDFLNRAFNPVPVAKKLYQEHWAEPMSAAGEAAAPYVQKAVEAPRRALEEIAPGFAERALGPYGMAAYRGGERLTEQAATPTNVALGAAISQAPRALARLAAAGFSIDMLKGAISSDPELSAAWEAKDIPKLIELGIPKLGQLAMGVGAGAHAAGGIPRLGRSKEAAVPPVEERAVLRNEPPVEARPAELDATRYEPVPESGRVTTEEAPPRPIPEKSQVDLSPENLQAAFRLPDGSVIVTGKNHVLPRGYAPESLESGFTDRDGNFLTLTDLEGRIVAGREAGEATIGKAEAAPPTGALRQQARDQFGIDFEELARQAQEAAEKYATPLRRPEAADQEAVPGLVERELEERPDWTGAGERGVPRQGRQGLPLGRGREAGAAGRALTDDELAAEERAAIRAGGEPEAPFEEATPEEIAQATDQVLREARVPVLTPAKKAELAARPGKIQNWTRTGAAFVEKPEAFQGPLGRGGKKGEFSPTESERLRLEEEAHATAVAARAAEERAKIDEFNARPKGPTEQAGGLFGRTDYGRKLDQRDLDFVTKADAAGARREARQAELGAELEAKSEAVKAARTINADIRPEKSFVEQVEEVQKEGRELSPVPDVGLGISSPETGLPIYKNDFTVRNYFGRQGMHQMERDFPESAKAIQRAVESPAYARTTGRADVKAISRAMGDEKGGEAGWLRFSRPMVDRQLQDMQERYVKAGQAENAAKVKRLMTDDALAQAMSTSEFKAAKQIYDRGMGAVMRDAHVANGGQRIASLGNDYYPLVSEEVGAGVSGSKIPLQKPRAPGSQHRTGLSEAYDVSSDALVGNLKRGPKAQYGRFPAALRANNIGRAIDKMVEEGAIRPLQQGERAPRVMEVNAGGKRYESSVTLQPTRRGNMLVPEPLWPEIKPALENVERPQQTRLGTLVSAPTQAAVLGVAEPLGHGQNIAMTLGKAKMIDFGAGEVGNRALNLPGVKQVAGFIKTIVDNPASPENMALLKEAHENGIFAPRIPFHNSPGAKFIARMDTNARLILYKSAKEFEPDATPTRLREVTRQLGEYSAQLASGAERAVKTGPFSRVAGSMGPFITAGKTMGLNAAEGYGNLLNLGTRPIGSSGLAGNIAASATRGVVAGVAMWVGAYKTITGKFPWDEGESRRYQLFKVPVPNSWRKTDWGKSLWGTKPGTAWIDFGGIAGMGRGARYLGLRGAANTFLRGGTPGQAGEAAAADIINSQTSPYAGPPPRAALRAFNIEPQLSGLRDKGGRFGPRPWQMDEQPTEPGWPTVKRAGERVFGALNPTEEMMLEGQRSAPGAGILRGIADTVRLPVTASGPTNIGKQRATLNQQLVLSRRAKKQARH